MKEVNLSLPVNPIHLLDQLVKANPAFFEEMDKNKELSDKYNKDSKKFEELQLTIDNLLAYMVDQVQGSKSDLGRDRLIPNQRIPAYYLRRAGAEASPSMIKSLRRHQFTSYGVPASRKQFGKEVGLSFAFDDPTHQPTKQEKKELIEWEIKLVERCFFPAGDNQPSLVKFLGEAYADFFDLDDITTETLRDGLNNPLGLQLQDPTIWYHTVSKVRQVPIRYDDDTVFDDSYKELKIEQARYEYVMVVNGQKIIGGNKNVVDPTTLGEEVKKLGATRDRINKEHFFERSDWYNWARGYSIVEQALNTIATMMNFLTYNASNVTRNRTPHGLMTLSGDGMNNQRLPELVKKLLWASMTGAGDKYRIPIIGLPKDGKADWVNIYSNPKELEFYTGISLYNTIIYSLAGTNPNLSGMPTLRDAVKPASITEPAQDGIWKQSQDPGLNTFLIHMQDVINQTDTSRVNIWQLITKLPVHAEFKGLASEDLKLKYELNKLRLETTSTLNEQLVEEGKEKIKTGILINGKDIADMPALTNTIVSQFYKGQIQKDQQKEQMEQQQALAAQNQPGQQGEQGGEAKPGEEPATELSEADRELIKNYGEPE
jgi:hypothetical protein